VPCVSTHFHLQNATTPLIYLQDFNVHPHDMVILHI
jgi:hypothetical protein